MFRKFMLLAGVVGMVLAMAAVCGAVQVNGYCYLGSLSNHAWIKILFQADSPSAITDSTYSSSSGYYQIEVAQGFYDIYFSYEGYQTEDLQNTNCFNPGTLPSQTLYIHLAGNLSGSLERNTYIIDDDVEVQSSDSLTIEPGAILLFKNYTGFGIYGKLEAIGTEADSIKFLLLEGQYWWSGLYFLGSASDSSKILYCRISQSVYGGICCNQSSITIQNSRISGNTKSGQSPGAGINLSYSNSVILNCDISNNEHDEWGGGIACEDDSEPLISHCTITGNTAGNLYSGAGGGISCSSSSNPTIMNCAIINNSAAEYGGGIYSYWPSEPIIANTIVANNNGNGGIYFWSTFNGEISYCDFFNNDSGNFTGYVPSWLGVIITVNANGDPCDGFFNIFLDPSFANPGIGNFQLRADSPCIDAGNPTGPPDPDGTIADIGAFYYNQLPVNDPPLRYCPASFLLHPCRPNPFNPTTVIRFDLPVAARPTLSVFDLQGRLVSELVNGWREAGVHEVTFDASNLASGMYIARIEANAFSSSGKMILLK